MIQIMKTSAKKYPLKISLVWALFAILSLLSILIIFMIGCIIFYRDYINFNQEKIRRRSEYLKERKQLIRGEVVKVIDYIHYSQAKIEQRLRKSMKDRVLEAHSIATNLYKEHKDTKGACVIRDMIDLVRLDGEGYYEYYWTKPNVEGRDFHKISYIKRFDPFNGFIETGEFRDDVEKDIQQEVREWIEKIQFGDDGYIFVYHKDGELLVNRFEPESIGENQWDITDPNGVKVVQLALLAADKPKGDFISYHWRKPGTNLVAAKISFVKLFPQWDWIIGAGIYTDDIDSEIAEMEETLKWNARSNFTILGVVLIIILLGILIFYYSISSYFQKQLDVFLTSFSIINSGGILIDTQKLAFQELWILADSVNTMMIRRHQAEESLRREKDRIQQYLDIAGVIILSIDTSGNVILINKKGCEILGVSEQDILGKNWFDHFIPEKKRDMIKRIFSEIISGKIELNEYMENEILCHDGVERIIEWHNTVVKDDAGRIVSILLSGKNITSYRKAESSLESRTQELESLFSISATLRSARHVDEMISVVLKEMRRVLKSDAGAVIQITPDRTNFSIAIADGILFPNTGCTFSIDEGISGRIMNTRETYITEDYSGDVVGIFGVKGAENLGPAILAPIQSETEFLGVLLAARLKDPLVLPFNDADVHLLTALGEMVGNALRRVQLHDQALTHLKHVETLHSIDMAITSSLDTRVVMDILLTKVTSELGIDAAAVLLFNPLTLTLEYDVWHGFRSNILKNTVFHLGDEFAGCAALERRIIYVSDLNKTVVDSFYSALLKDEGFISYYAIPLITKGQVKGVLETFHRKSHISSTEWLEFLEAIASQAAIAIDNVQLFNDLQRSNIELALSYDTALEAWTRALDLHNHESEGHTRRIIQLTLKVARELDMNEDQLIHLRRGALLHDIGKIQIPDSILLKPDKLSSEEWEIMRSHPRHAYELLSPIPCLQPALDIPYCHHEKWDGTGYPRGLKGDNIPLAAQIFAVVDVWDALTSDRPYRPAWSRKKTLDYIFGQMGKYFNPDLATAFSKIIENDLKESTTPDWDMV
jgi:PAS domain S-box-containing protein